MLAPISPEAHGTAGHGDPLVGFSFRYHAVEYQDMQPEEALRTLLTKLRPDLVRVPVYWRDVAPTPDSFDFWQTDRLLQVINDFNRVRGGHRVRVVLVVGVRNMDYPEVYVPEWVNPEINRYLPQVTRLPQYGDYLDATFARYSDMSNLYGWQVENEPLDRIQSSGDIEVPAERLRSEVQRLRQFDPVRPVVVTTFNSAELSLDRKGASAFSWLLTRLPGPQPAGNPLPALRLGDALGLDIYVANPYTPAAETAVGQRIAWKQETLRYWAEQAAKRGKELWITEMQAAPWDDLGASEFTEDDLRTSAAAYRDAGPSVILLWGVESWLESPQWMEAGLAAVHTLRPGRHHRSAGGALSA
jgi:hypothetical protein